MVLSRWLSRYHSRRQARGEGKTKTGRWLLMRLRPYRTVEDRIDGVVVSVPEQRRYGFYRAGALLVSGAGVPPGCLAWGRPRA